MTETAAAPPDARVRCPWGDGADPAYRAYHDEEWGVPIRDERHLFELLILEGAQAGLSWSTILRKREGYRAAFAGFDVAAVAAFGDADVARLLADAGHRPQPGEGRRGDRQRAGRRSPCTTRARPSSTTCGRSSAATPVQNAWVEMGTIPAETDTSKAMSADLRRRGFRFVGPTICYALMQSAGLVNDHLVGCFRYAEVAGEVPPAAVSGTRARRRGA